MQVRGDLSGGINLLTRAASVLPEHHPTRRAILPELGSALMRAGDLDRAETVLTAALDAASAAGDRRLELRTLIEREFFREFTRPEGSVEEILGVTDGSSRCWRSSTTISGSRKPGFSRARQTSGPVDGVRARRRWSARWSTPGERVTPRWSNHRLAPRARALLRANAREEAIRRCETFLVQADEDRSVLAATKSTLAGLRAMQGDFAQGRRLWSEAEAIYEDLGLKLRRVIRSLIPAEIESLAENVNGAVEGLRTAYESATEMHARSISATIAAFLADALCDQENTRKPSASAR